MPWRDWEGAAGALLGEIALEEPPQDAFEIMAMCGLRLAPWGQRGAALVDGVIHYNPADRPVRVQGNLFHELGHFAARRAGLEDSEPAANYIGGALALPRRAFDRDLRATAWDLRRLQAKHLNCSAELISLRIVNLRDAVATVIDDGRVKTRVASPWLTDSRFRRLSVFERELARLAEETGQTQRPDPDGLLWAFPVFDPPWRRVVVICEAEQLTLRF